MSIATTSRTELPTGTWQLDPVHSSIGFSVRHMLVSTFEGEITDIRATLAVDDDAARLEGTGLAASVRVADESLTAHLLAPDFFDAERHPEIRLTSEEIRRDGDAVSATAEFTLRGITRPIELEGTVAGPVEDPYGNARLGLTLETVVNRTDFGLIWNAPLPGGGLVLGDAVTLTARLELVRDA